MIAMERIDTVQGYRTKMFKPHVKGVREMNPPSDKISQLRQQYRSALFDDVTPWWERHSLDREHGGYYSLLERDGHVWSTDKYMWMNGRQVWMFSHLYNRQEPRPAWLENARLGADFMLRHAYQRGDAPDQKGAPGGKMVFRSTREGKPVSSVLSLYTEVFASMALAELSRAEKDDDNRWAQATASYAFLMSRLGRPSDTPMLGYPVDAKFHLHAHDMCRITVAWVFNEIRPGPRFEEDLTASVDSILQRHWKPEIPALLENVAPDGSAMLDMPEGRFFHPGHALESAWMLMEIARRHEEPSLLDSAVEIILCALNQGWDEEYGGIKYLTNIDGTPTHELEMNMKLWWVHVETLYALLLAWSLAGGVEANALPEGSKDRARRQFASSTAADELWRWYERVHDYTFTHFPDPEHGEWYGYLDRDGRPAWTAKANGWKGFFHLPRSLFRCYRLLDALADDRAG